MSLIDVKGKMEVKMFTREVKKLMALASSGAVKEFALKTADRAEKLAPEGPTGNLKRGIKGKVRKARGEDRFIGTISQNTEGKQSSTRKGRVKTPRRSNYRGYGLDVEVGRTDRKYTSTPHMRPAFRATIPEIPTLFKQGAAKEARKQARKRGRPRKTKI